MITSVWIIRHVLSLQHFCDLLLFHLGSRVPSIKPQELSNSLRLNVSVILRLVATASIMHPTLEKASESTKLWANEVKSAPLLLAWYLCAFLSVFIPLLVFIICRSRFDIADDPNNYDEQKIGALIFVYIWMLISFCVVVYVGHKFFLNPQDKSFFVTLVTFANLAFVACILSASIISALDGHEWNGRMYSLFPACMLLTFALWTALCVVFAGVLYWRMKKASDKVEEDAYQRQPDEETASRKDASSERDPAAPPVI